MTARVSVMGLEGLIACLSEAINRHGAMLASSVRRRMCAAIFLCCCF